MNHVQKFILIPSDVWENIKTKHPPRNLLKEKQFHHVNVPTQLEKENPGQLQANKTVKNSSMKTIPQQTRALEITKKNMKKTASQNLIAPMNMENSNRILKKRMSQEKANKVMKNLTQSERFKSSDENFNSLTIPMEYFAKKKRIHVGKIIQLLRKQMALSYNSNFQLIYKSKPIHGSNIVKLLEHAVDKHTGNITSLKGWKLFYTTLHKLHASTKLVLNPVYKRLFLKKSAHS